MRSVPSTHFLSFFQPSMTHSRSQETLHMSSSHKRYKDYRADILNGAAVPVTLSSEQSFYTLYDKLTVNPTWTTHRTLSSYLLANQSIPEAKWPFASRPAFITNTEWQSSHQGMSTTLLFTTRYTISTMPPPLLSPNNP